MKKNILLSLIESSMGELNWIAPCLERFKLLFPEWTIIVVILNSKVYNDVQNNTPLIQSLQGKAQILSIEYFASKILPSIAKDIHIVLRDYSPDKKASLRNQCIDIFPDALHVVHPHSNHVYSNLTTDHVYNIPIKSSTFREDRFDLLLLNSKYDIPFWSEYTPIEKIRTFGSPCYDNHWLKSLLSSNVFLNSEETLLSKKYNNVFLYISRGEHHVYQSLSNYKYLLHSTMKKLLCVPDSFVFIRAHPRQDTFFLLEMLRAYPSSRWKISTYPLPLLAYLSNFVVSTWSSGIIDALSVNRPVIEYFKFPQIELCWRVDKNGFPTSIYRELGLALAANDELEFEKAIATMLKNKNEVLKLQKSNLHKLCVYDNNASEKYCFLLYKKFHTKNYRKL